MNPQAVELINLVLEEKSLEELVRDWREQKSKVQDLIKQAEEIAKIRDELGSEIMSKLREVEGKSVVVDNIVTKIKTRTSKYVSYKSMFLFTFSKLNAQTKRVIVEFQKTITSTKEHERLVNEMFGIDLDWLKRAGRRVVDSIRRVWTDFFRGRELKDWEDAVDDLEQLSRELE